MPQMIIPLSFLIKERKITQPDGPQTFAPRNARMIIFSIPFTMIIALWVGIPFCGMLVSLQGVPKALLKGPSPYTHTLAPWLLQH